MGKKSSPLIIGNFYGYYGDWPGAIQQVVRHKDVQYIVGDYLSEPTMPILHGKQIKGKAGYLSLSLRQFDKVASHCQKNSIKTVINAGALAPKILAQKFEEKFGHLGFKVAYIEGDNLVGSIGKIQAAGEEFTSMDNGKSLAHVIKEQGAGAKIATANAYLGGWGITKALGQGADIVITGRGMDAAPLMGIVAHHYNLKRTDLGILSSAFAAGHFSECGAHVTGGNFSSHTKLQPHKNIGYPIIEFYEDGSFIVTKPEGTGGMVTVDTVKAQALYEIQGNLYKSPDVSLYLPSIKLTQEGKNRVRVGPCEGFAPPPEHKVCITIARNEPPKKPKPQNNSLKQDFARVTFGLAGLDRKDKVDMLLEQLKSRMVQDGISMNKFNSIDVDVTGNPDDRYQMLNLTAKADDTSLLSAFRHAANGLLLSTYPGCFVNTPFVQHAHHPALVNSKHIGQTVHVDGKEIKVEPTSQMPGYSSLKSHPKIQNAVQWKPQEGDNENIEHVYLRRLVSTRAGDKGGNANLGVWVTDNPELYEYICYYLTPENLRKLDPELLGDFEIERHELPNLEAVNFIIKGILGDGASANKNIDKQAKALGEVLGAHKIPVPTRLLKGMNIKELQRDSAPLPAGKIEFDFMEPA